MMTPTVTRHSTRMRAAHRAERERYPHDYLHEENRSYAQTQADIGGGLLIGAVALAVLMTLLVMGLA
jgi:hypothetical protein